MVLYKMSAIPIIIKEVKTLSTLTHEELFLVYNSFLGTDNLYKMVMSKITLEKAKVLRKKLDKYIEKQRKIADRQEYLEVIWNTSFYEKEPGFKGYFMKFSDVDQFAYTLKTKVHEKGHNDISYTKWMHDKGIKRYNDGYETFYIHKPGKSRYDEEKYDKAKDMDLKTPILKDLILMYQKIDPTVKNEAFLKELYAYMNMEIMKEIDKFGEFREFGEIDSNIYYKDLTV